MLRRWWHFVRQSSSCAGVALWGLLVVVGTLCWAYYESLPGVAANAPAFWTGYSALQLGKQRPTLVVVLHPKCPCSKATVSELAVLMDRWLQDIRAYVVFMQIDDEDGASDESSLREAVVKIPGVEVLDDRDGAILGQLGAFTSGQTYLYDSQGKLIFQGGLTPVRGQTGTNRGSLAIASYLTSSVVRDQQTPVYGCSLNSLGIK